MEVVGRDMGQTLAAMRGCYHILPEYGKNPQGTSSIFLTLNGQSPFFNSVRKLKTWRTRHNRDTAHALARETVFAPLVIIPQTPGESRERPRLFSLRRDPLHFRKQLRLFGLWSPDGELLVSLLYLITHSQLYQHFCLIRSSRIGASYRTFIKEDLRHFLSGV